MTVASEVRSVEYDGDDGTTEFPVPFEVLDVSHVQVTYYPASGAAVVLTRGVNPGFLLNAVGEDVKDVYPVTASVPLKVGATIVVERVVPVTQVVDLTNQGSFDAETHEEIADLGVMVDQQLLDRIKALESAGAPGSVLAGNGFVRPPSNARPTNAPQSSSKPTPFEGRMEADQGDGQNRNESVETRARHPRNVSTTVNAATDFAAASSEFHPW